MDEVNEELAAARVRPACARCTRGRPRERTLQRGRTLQENSEAAQGDNHAKNDLSARGVLIEI